MMWRIPGLLLVAAISSGCVLKDRYRYVRDQPTCFDSNVDPVPGAPGEKRPFPSVDCRSTLYKTAFVEFDEQGSHIDPAQADIAVALINHEKGSAKRKVIVLAFVHGWKNNGNEQSPGTRPQDVERFTSALSELGFRAKEASSTNPVPVIGVYIGWRGKSLMGPGFFTWLSYWGRRGTANRIGGDPLTAFLNKVIDTTVPADTDQSRVMLAGHSFGARVLERAIENGVKLYDPEKVRAAGEPVRPRVDLVLYVNAANDSRLGFARVQALRDKPIIVRHPDYDVEFCKDKPANPRCRSYPLITAITSRGDQATRRVQPIANALNFDGDSAPLPELPVEAGRFLELVPSARSVKRSSPANLPFLQSHRITEETCPASPAEFACDPTDISCAFAFQGRGECTACFKARARQGEGTRLPFNQTAYWIMDVDARVIRDHGDIWNQSTLSMLGAMMSPRGFFEPGAARMQVLSP